MRTHKNPASKKNLRATYLATRPGRDAVKRRFRITEYEERGPIPSREDPVGKIRLVCITDSREKLVFWGGKGNTENIDKVKGAGLPCELECEYHEPQEWARSQHEHKYWVAEDAHVTIA